MGVTKFDEACRLIRQMPELTRFVSAAPSDEAIRRAEELLGLPLPPSYKAFLSKFGAGRVGSDEIYGLVGENVSAEGVPNVVWATLQERHFGLPLTQIVIGVSGDGEVFSLAGAQADRHGEYPVVIFIPGSDVPQSEILASDFGAYFLDRLHEASMSRMSSGQRSM